jgi:hypothetical protein
MKVALAAAASISILVFSFNVQALPGSPHQIYVAPSVVLVAPGCGRGVPRTPEGGCAVAGQTRKLARPSGVNGTVCPPGTHLNNSGRSCVK